MTTIDPTSTSLAAVAHDQALFARIRARDETALADLYDRHGTALYTLALRIVRDPSIAQEAVQDVFWRAWNECEQYDPARGRVGAWLIGMTRNRAIDLTRRRAQLDRKREATQLPDADAMSDGGKTVGERVVIAQWVGTALSELPAHQREPLELAYYGGLSQTEIATKLGEPLGTVKTRMRTALLKLKSLLEPASARAQEEARG